MPYELTLDSPLSFVRGVGETRSQQFAKRGVRTVGDLLTFYPRAYEDRGNVLPLRDCADGGIHAVEVVCTSLPVSGRARSGLEYFRFCAEDDTGMLTVTVFNRRFLLSQIVVGRRYRLYGRISMGLFGAEMSSPEVELVIPGKPLEAVLPVYPLSEGLTRNFVRKIVKNCLSLCDQLPELLPAELREKYGLLPRGEAVRRLHEPKDLEETVQAKRTVAFAELLSFQLALRRMRHAKDGAASPPLPPPEEGGSFLERLPFPLTGAQAQAIREIFADFEKPVPMTRLVQGDVGSGKTVVAAAAIERCVQNGKQAVLLAPTEILAEQHFGKLTEWFDPADARIALLTSAVPKKWKETVKKSLAAGEVDVLVGTHAVLQEDVHFASLGLVVTDEQHRFGVRQRASLLERGEKTGLRPHMLVLSATPIPRSLSLILYGDLDVTLLRELPPGRQPIKTMVLLPKDRNRIYASIRRQIAQGGQAYIICPLVGDDADGEPAESEDCKAAESYFAELRNGAFSDIPMGLLHGKMSPSRKAEVMRAFAAGETKVLVATTVVEVGVDVPNANVMLIENAERFGLSQLHQLRGRIGRGTRASFCVLLNSSGGPCERLDVLANSSDGFQIAEEDLKQRGPGDFFGDRQSGEFALRAASLADLPLVKQTAEAVGAVLEKLGEPEYRALSDEADAIVRRAGDGKTIN